MVNHAEPSIGIFKDPDFPSDTVGLAEPAFISRTPANGWGANCPASDGRIHFPLSALVPTIEVKKELD
jgi:hypothetical protein